MVASLGIRQGASVLDFGCGQGRYTIALSQAVGEKGHVYAFERSEEDLAVARLKLKAFSSAGNVTFIKTEKEKIAHIINDNTIDSILAFDVLQYIQDLDGLFSSFLRVIKPTGIVHIYPAAIPHPGAIAMDLIVAKMTGIGFKKMNSDIYKMMHNVDMVDDTIYSFCFNTKTQELLQ